MRKATTNAELDQKLDYLLEKVEENKTNTNEKLDELKKTVNEKLVTKDYLELRLQPLDLSRKIVFAAVGLGLTSFFVALIGLVVK